MSTNAGLIRWGRLTFHVSVYLAPPTSVAMATMARAIYVCVCVIPLRKEVTNLKKVCLEVGGQTSGDGTKCGMSNIFLLIKQDKETKQMSISLSTSTSCYIIAVSVPFFWLYGMSTFVKQIDGFQSCSLLFIVCVFV